MPGGPDGLRPDATRTALKDGLPSGDVLGQQVRRSFHPERSGDVAFLLKPYSFCGRGKRVHPTARPIPTTRTCRSSSMDPESSLAGGTIRSRPWRPRPSWRGLLRIVPPASAAAPVPADPFLPWPSGVILLLTSTRPLARVPPTLKWLDQPCPKGGRQPRPFAARGSRDAAGDSFLWGRGKAMGRKPFFGLLGVCLAGLAVCGCQPQQKVDSSTRQSPQLTSTTATNPSFGAFGNSNSSGSYPSSGYAGSTTNGGYPSSGYAGSTTSGGYPSSGYAGSTTNGGYPSSGYAGSTTSGGYPSSGYAGSTTSGGYPSSGYAGSTTSGGYPSSGYAGSTTSGGYRMSTPSSGFSGSTLSGSSTPSIGTRTGSNLDSSSSTTPTPSVNSITPTTGSAGPNNTNLPALPSSTAPTSGTSLSSRSSVVSPSSLPLLPTAVDTQSSAGKSGVPPLSTNSSSAGGSSTLQLPDLPRLTPPVPPQLTAPSDPSKTIPAVAPVPSGI